MSTPLSQILAAKPAASIDDVVRIMTAIDGALPDTDGLKWFNRLYLSVTLAVRGAVTAAPAGGTSVGISTATSEATAIGTAAMFHDPRFMSALDIVFANLYFDAAVAGDVSPSNAPPAWRPLFKARHTPGLQRIQWALAGMNAHINRDLPFGIVATCQAVGGAPRASDPRHDDFTRVNAILEAVEAQVKSEFAVGIVGAIDAVAGRADDAVAMWNIHAAREAAWINAEVLWTLRSVPALRDAFGANLDSFTGFAGRGLLVCKV